MKRHYFSSIRSQIWMIIIISLCIVLVSGFAFNKKSTSIMKEQAEEFVHTLLKKTADEIESVAGDMIYAAESMTSNEVVKNYLRTNDALNKYSYGQTIQDFASGLLQNSATLAHILIVNPNGHIVSATQHNISVVDTLEREYHIFDVSNQGSGFIAPLVNTYDNTTYWGYYAPIYNTQTGVGGQRKLGNIVVLSRFSTLISCFSEPYSSSGSIMLVDAEGNSLAVRNADELDVFSFMETDLQFLLEKEDGVFSIRNSYILDKLTLPSVGWLIISAVPSYDIVSDIKPLVVLVLFILILTAILFMVWGVLLNRSITVPLTQMTAFMNDFGKEHTLARRLKVTEGNEIGMLAGQINTLLDKVMDMTNENMRSQAQMYELNIAKTRAEISALRSQINPHFLYNTLDCIKGYGYLLGSDEVVEITNSLSTILRYSIKGDDIVPLKTELNMVTDYLRIIRIRFEERFTFVFNIDEHLKEAAIPRFILQPLVENAVIHGLEPQLAHGMLKIEARPVDENSFVLSVADDGAGIPQEMIAKINEKLYYDPSPSEFAASEKSSIGIINVQHRIRKQYGIAYGLTLESQQGKGTTVSVHLPFIRYEKKDM